MKVIYNHGKKEAKYYSFSAYGDFAYTTKAELKEWSDYLAVYKIKEETGIIDDLKPKSFKIVGWQRSEAERKPNKH